MTPESDADATRRTYLAAERTWLAWWRTGIAVATAAIAVGGVVPELVGGARAPYVVLGMGYGALSVLIFVGGAIRQRDVERALEGGTYSPLPLRWVTALSAVGAVLGLATLVMVAAQV